MDVELTVETWCDVDTLVCATIRDLYGKMNLPYIKQCMAPMIQRLTQWHYQLLSTMSEPRFMQESLEFFNTLLQLYQRLTFDTFYTIIQHLEDYGMVIPRGTMLTIVVLTALFQIYGQEHRLIKSSLDSCRLAQCPADILTNILDLQLVLFNSRNFLCYDFAHSFIRLYLVPPKKPQRVLCRQYPKQRKSTNVVQTTSKCKARIQVMRFVFMTCVLYMRIKRAWRQARKLIKLQRHKFTKVLEELMRVVRAKNKLVKKEHARNIRNSNRIKLQQEQQETRKAREMVLILTVLLQWKRVMRAMYLRTNQNFMRGFRAKIHAIRTRQFLVSAMHYVISDAPSSPSATQSQNVVHEDDEKHLTLSLNMELPTHNVHTHEPLCSETIYWNFQYARFLLNRIYLEGCRLFCLFKNENPHLPQVTWRFIAEHVRDVQTLLNPFLACDMDLTTIGCKFNIKYHIELAEKLALSTFVQKLSQLFNAHKSLEKYQNCLSLFRSLQPMFLHLAKTFRKIKSPTNSQMFELYNSASRKLTPRGNQLCEEFKKKFALFQNVWMLVEHNLPFAMKQWLESGCKHDVMLFLARVQFAMDRFEKQKQKQTLTIHITDNKRDSQDRTHA